MGCFEILSQFSKLEKTMLKTRQNTWSLFSIFRLSQIRRRDSSNTNTPSNVRILHFYINCTCIVHVLFVKSMTILCLTMFCALAERQKKKSQIRFCFIYFSDFVSGYHNINWYQCYVDKTKRKKSIVGRRGLEFDGNYKCGWNFS